MNYGRFVLRRLKTFGVKSRDAWLVSNWLTSQLRSMGETRGLAFIKDVGLALTYAIVKDEKRRVPWVKCHSRFPVALNCLRRYPTAILLRVSTLFKVVVLEKLTPGQVQKFQSAVQSEPRPVGSLRELSATIIRGVSHLGYPDFPSEIDYPSVATKWRQFESESGDTPLTAGPPILESIARVKSAPVWALPNWERALYPANVPVLSRAKLPDIDGYVGTIGCTQEPGGKARFFAAPHAIYQALLDPLYQFVKRLLSRFQSDCTDNQEKGALWAQDRLKAGKPVVSADTRNATDLFPYIPQVDALRHLGVDDSWILALDFLVRGEWKLPDYMVALFKADSISWTNGQPLGIIVSFCLYALCHNALLFALAAELGLDPNDSFRILGDDVVMVPELYPEYRRILLGAGVTFSDEKSFSSQYYAEFAGYRILPGLMLRPGKWPRVNVVNHVSLALDLGKVLELECAPHLQLIQKVALFHKGLYDPQGSDWGRFLHASSVLSKELEPRPIPNAPFYRDGLLQYLKEQTGMNQNNLILPGYNDYSAAFRALPVNNHSENWRIVSAAARLSNDFSPQYQLQDAYLKVHIAIWRMVESEMCTYSEGVNLLERAYDACLSELYVPPRNKLRGMRDLVACHHKVSSIVKKLQLT